MQGLKFAVTDRRRCVQFIGVVGALALVLLLMPTLVADEDAEPGTRILYPGTNPVGWVYFPTPVEDFFEQVPEAEMIYTWDAERSHFRFSAPGLNVGLRMLEPGMGLIVRIGGDALVEWQQPTVANGEWISLMPGPNLVAWTGPSETPVDLAVRSIGQSFQQAHYWMPESGEFGVYQPESRHADEDMPTLSRGDALWVFNDSELRWLQPSGDRPLHLLGPPPDHVRWYRSFDKYLDADGIAVISTENVADEALFRAAAILDEMLVNRPDIRETLVRQRVHFVVVGQSEETYDLTPYRQYRDRVELEPWGEAGPRGLGPNQFTPTLIPEENVLCFEDDPYRETSVAVHEFAHAIEFAIGRGIRGGSFGGDLARSYQAARASQLWDDSYGLTNTAEFWAIAVGAWIGAKGEFNARFTNGIDLSLYAPEISELIDETLGSTSLDASCHRVASRTSGVNRNVLIEGQLTDHAGAALDNVRIVIEDVGDESVKVSGVTWSDGRYHMYAPPGNYTISAVLEGCSVLYLDGAVVYDRSDVDARTVLDRDQDISFMVPRDMCRHRVNGLLTDADGQPGAGVRIDLIGSLAHSRTTTTHEGRFSIGLHDGGEYRLTFNHQGCTYEFDGANPTLRPGKGTPVLASLLSAEEWDLRIPDEPC